MADQKITELTADTAPASTDLLVTVDDPSGSAVTKKATIANVVKAVQGINATVLLDSVLTGTQATFSASGIGTYDWIEVLLYVRTDRAATADNVQIEFNGDTTDTNYRANHQSDGGTSSVDWGLFGTIPANTAAANYFGVIRGTLPQPSATVGTKCIIWLCGYNSVADSTTVSSNGTVNWENTAAVTSILIRSYTDSNFVAGSRCLIIGYKVA